MIYLLTVLFTLSFVLYSKYQFNDEKNGWGLAKGRWHTYGMAMRILFFLSFLVYKYFPFTIWDVLICAGLSVLFDIGINLIALHVKWNYVGTTSKIDKFFGKLKWYLYSVFLSLAVIGKIFFKNKKLKK